MFFKSRSKVAPSAYKDHSFIGKHAEVTGDIRFQGGLHVEGQVQGNIRADEGCLHLHGEIEGDIEVPHAVINGIVRGNLTCHEHLELAAGAQVYGSVAYRSMEMMLGAQVTGSLQPLSNLSIVGSVKEPAA